MPVHKGFPADRQQLWIPAVEAIQLGALWSWPRGWSVNIGVRRQGESWADCQQDNYLQLSRAETWDVIERTVMAALDI